jgi:hypothetical protein
MCEIALQRVVVVRNVRIVDAARKKIRRDGRKSGAMRRELGNRRRGEARIGEVDIREDLAERIVEADLARDDRIGEEEPREASRRLSYLDGIGRGGGRAGGRARPECPFAALVALDPSERDALIPSVRDALLDLGAKIGRKIERACARGQREQARDNQKSDKGARNAHARKLSLRDAHAA